MTAVEIACALVLALYALTHARETGWLRDAALLAVAGWIGEETCIHFYGFYAYSTAWHARILDVPLLIALIWPAIVLSARSIARQMVTGSARLAVLTGALVVFDAALIEPIAVRSGLWFWTQPGLFNVPPIGILGWGFFAGAATSAMENWRGARRAGVIAFAPAATHAMLLAGWWLCLRWVLRGVIPPGVGVAVVAAASTVILRAVWKSGARLSRSELVSRAAATALFAVLLARAPEAWLVAYALAFTPPHLVMSARAGKVRGRRVTDPAGQARDAA